jgi:hypothetical protein
MAELWRSSEERHAKTGCDPWDAVQEAATARKMGDDRLPSYREASQDLRFQVGSAIRRKAWGDRRSLYLRDPRHDLCSSRIKGRFPDGEERYPTGYQVIPFIDSLSGLPGSPDREEWWRVPDEDVNSDDWECRRFGRWESAK